MPIPTSLRMEHSSNPPLNRWRRNPVYGGLNRLVILYITLQLDSGRVELMVQCRIRKRKCGGQPPDPCPNCIHGHNECSWPVEDGRSSNARREKARARLKLAQPGIMGMENTVDTPNTNWEMGDTGWMSSLGDLGFGELIPSTGRVRLMYRPICRSVTYWKLDGTSYCPTILL